MSSIGFPTVSLCARVLCLWACLVPVFSRAAEPGTPDQPELTFFAFDEDQLGWQHNLRLTLESPRKHPANPVLRCGPKGSPDFGHALLYGTVIHYGGKFRMWYLGMIQRELERGQAPGWWRPMCYAESDDGIHWIKPELGLVELNGNKRNNICLVESETPTLEFVNDFLSVLHEPHDPDPSRRYKCAYIAHPDIKHIAGGTTGIGVKETRVGALITATSADGLRWKVVGDRPANAGAERFEVSSLYRWSGFYYASGQLASPWCWLNDGRPAGRVMMTYRSPDFRSWSRAKALSMVRPEQILLPQPSVNDMLAGHANQMHMGVAVWNRGNVLIGVPGLWQGNSKPADNRDRLQGVRIDLGLAYSTDGVRFREPIPNHKFLTHGAAGEWDAISLLQGHAFVNICDQTMIWYSHWDSEGRFRSQEIGLATMRRDGFGYLSRHDAGDPGHCVTSPLTFGASGGAVFVNVDGAAQDAPVLVELLDEKDQPTPGFSGDAAARIEVSGTRVAATWKADLASLRGRKAQVRVTLPDNDAARLYAIYVERTP